MFNPIYESKNESTREDRSATENKSKGSDGAQNTFIWGVLCITTVGCVLREDRDPGVLIAHVGECQVQKQYTSRF